MDDLTASLLILLLVSPAMAVLYVLIARGARDIWKACVVFARAELTQALQRRVPFPGRLCCENS
jgi:hypothetical protein